MKSEDQRLVEPVFHTMILKKLNPILENRDHVHTDARIKWVKGVLSVKGSPTFMTEVARTLSLDWNIKVTQIDDMSYVIKFL